MELDLQVIRQQVVHATKALLEQANLKAGDIFVLGCSSSEICGGHIGKRQSGMIWRSSPLSLPCTPVEPAP